MQKAETVVRACRLDVRGRSVQQGRAQLRLTVLLPTVSQSS